MPSARLTCIALILTAGFALQGCGGTFSTDSSNARIRLLNASIGYDSLDLYVSTDDDEEDSLEIEAVEYGNVSEYVELNSDTYTIKVRRNGATSTLYTISDVDLADASHMTLVAWGRSGALALQSIDEDVGEPDPDNSKLSLLNASGAGSVDIYVTEESEDLEDASPITSTTTIDSDSYRLRVTGSSDTDDLRLDVPNLALESEQVATVILTATQGGVLVNAFFLTQQGELQKFLNSKSRIRGAVGLASGSAATLDVGDVALLSNAATGVIGNKYWQVDAGSVPVELSVNGTTIGVENQELEAGGDYTFLVLDNAGTTEMKLVEDDNFLPESSSTAKVRILHAMSGLDQAITLTVDFFPIIEGLPHGEASEYVEIDSGLSYQYDVSNASTTAIIWTRDDVELQNGSVYTLFMSGGDPTVNGSLRKDR
jgi:uncharacterized protein DUF4397